MIAAENYYAIDLHSGRVTRSGGIDSYRDLLRNDPKWIHFIAVHVGLPKLTRELAYTFLAAGKKLDCPTPSIDRIYIAGETSATRSVQWMAKAFVNVDAAPLLSIELRRRLTAENNPSKWPMLTRHIEYLPLVHTWDIGWGLPFHSLKRQTVRDGTTTQDNIYRPLIFFSLPIKMPFFPRSPL